MQLGMYMVDAYLSFAEVTAVQLGDTDASVGAVSLSAIMHMNSLRNKQFVVPSIQNFTKAVAALNWINGILLDF